MTSFSNFLRITSIGKTIPIITKCSTSSKRSSKIVTGTDFSYAQSLSTYSVLKFPAIIPENIPAAKVGKIASDDEKRAFLEVFPDIVQDLTQLGSVGDISKAQKWNAKVLQYNALGGKLNRGLAVSLSLKKIMSPDVVDEQTIRKANILGWAIELLQSHFLMVDDIMDESKMRRGKDCWYLKEGVGKMAINDSLLLNADLFKLLKIHFINEPYYIDMVNLFHDASLKTILGQCLDMQASPTGSRPNFALFTMDHYDAIVKNKTAFYSFYLPVALAMFMADIRENDNTRVANITDREIHRQARTILLEMGSFFQIQDDFLDVFGDPRTMGKIGSDIANGKCSWLAVVAIQRASPRQRKVMEEHYGIDDEGSIEIIRNLYNELSLPSTYKAYEDSSMALIRTHIQQISRGLNHDVFFALLSKIYKRSS